MKAPDSGFTDVAETVAGLYKVVGIAETPLAELRQTGTVYRVTLVRGRISGRMVQPRCIQPGRPRPFPVAKHFAAGPLAWLSGAKDLGISQRYPARQSQFYVPFSHPLFTEKDTCDKLA